MPTANLSRVANLPPEERLKGLLEEQRLQLLEIRPRTDLAVSPSSFQANASFGQPAFGFRISFVGTNPDGSGIGLGDVMEELTPQSWPPRSYDMSASRAQLSVGATVPVPSPALADDGVVATLKNLSNGDQFTLVGSEPPSGPNVTISQDYTYEFTTPANTNEVMGRTFIGTARLPSGWLVSFTKAVFIYESQPDRELSACQMEWAPPPPESITIANATFTPRETSTNANLDFQISTVNATLKSWTVDLQQNSTTIRSFPFTTDTRGPGTAVGSNPTNVTLGWDGLDSSNRAVTGNVTWQITAQTMNYVSGGPVNDGIHSAQATVNGSVNEGPAPRLVNFGCEEVTMLDVQNNPIPVPQYDPGRSRRSPIALPMRAARIKAIVRIGIREDDGEDTQFIIQGRKLTSLPGRDPIFGPKLVKFNAPRVREKDFDFPVEVPQRIEKIDDIVWEYQKLKDGTVKWVTFSVSNSPIYVTWDKPRPPQREPRVDVLDYAVGALLATDQRTIDDVVLAKALTTHIYRGGFRYDVGRPHHTVAIGDQQGLIVSDFLTFPGNVDIDNQGNCLDFSNLFQVLGAALGSENFRTSYIDGPFIGRPVKPIGSPLDPAPGQINLHQVGWCSSSDSVFDPTYRLTLEDGVTEFEALDVKRHKYRDALQDRSKSPHKWEWLTPTRPVRVR